MGTVEKVIKPADPREPDKAQIAIERAEDLYREIRIENVLKDEKGEEVALKEGATPVDVTIEADKKDDEKGKLGGAKALAALALGCSARQPRGKSVAAFFYRCAN